MEKLYLPQDFTGVFPKEEYSYDSIALDYFTIGFTKNRMQEMNTGLIYKDLLNANLTAITWIEILRGNFYKRGQDIPDFEEKIKICTIYLDRGGFVVEGFYKTLKYKGEILPAPDNMSSDARINNRQEDEYNITRLFKSQGMELHKEIFVDKLIRIEGFEDVKINPKSIFFNLLKDVSIFNRCCDMNYVYAIAHEEKETFENVKQIVGLAALPFTIEAGAFIKALQASIGLVSYLCDIDSTFHLSDELFEFKGPVVISDVYTYTYRNTPITNAEGDRDWQSPTKDPSYDSGAIGTKQDAIEKFKNLQII